MRILMIGDVVGKSGCELLRNKLSAVKKYYGADITVVNGENSAEGNGMTPVSADHIFASGADVVTGGNHTFRRREIYRYLDENPFVLRPANYPEAAPGKGMCIVDRGAFRVAVISIMGQVYMNPVLDSPFREAERLVKRATEESCKFIIVDFHAEATGEKKSLACFLDGKITALCGTHTHVQTADEKVLPGGTAYITDLGMSGPENSVLGVKPELTIAMMKDKLPTRFETAGGDSVMNGCIITASRESGLAEKIERIEIR